MSELHSKQKMLQLKHKLYLECTEWKIPKETFLLNFSLSIRKNDKGKGQFKEKGDQTYHPGVG